MSMSLIEEVLPGIDDERSYEEISATMELNMGKMPVGFPHKQWSEQSERYLAYWRWWQGTELDEILAMTSDNEPVYKFPLKINTIRTYGRIHNAMLWGETSDNESLPLVRAKVKPKASLVTDEVSEEQKQESKFYERVIAEVWDASDGRAMCWEAGLNSQTLGGSYFQLKYQPWRTDLLIPIVITTLKPDFVLPVWGENPWELLEAYVIYRMTPVVAQKQFGINIASSGTHVTYVEHWTKTHQSIFIDGVPLEATYTTPYGETVKISHNNQPNVFGFVPIYYIPRMREGNFYGSSLVPDVAGMVREINGRMADNGSVIQQNNERIFLGRNITSTPRPKDFGKTRKYFDLGSEIPYNKSAPELWSLDPPNLTSEMGKFVNDVRGQSDRDAFISPIAYGEDEGSQRSGITLQIRMWPTISIARAQRGFWSTGLRHINMGILRIMAIHKLMVDGRKVNMDFSKRITIEVLWNPFLPRDEEQMTNRIVRLTETNNMSLERSLELQGDVEDIELEAERIRKQQAEEAAALNQGNNQGESSTIESPVADSVEDGE